MKKLIYLTPLLLLAACGGSNTSIFISKTCSIDQPIENAILPAEKSFNVSGWMFDKQSGALPDHVRIQFSSNNRQFIKTFDAKYGLKRMDVAQALNAPAAESSGFNLEVSANSLTPGSYEVVILQDVSNATLVCGSGHTIQVK